jgi:broad specificity phosphatase PhoE
MADMIYLVRHGQASFGAANYDRLSETGHRQAELTGPFLPKVSSTISGSMLRHIQTAHAAMPEAAILQDARWDEFDYLDVIRPLRPDLATHGALVSAMRAEANPHRAFQGLYAAAVERWCSGQYDSDYQESRGAFCARVLQAFDTLEGTQIVFTSGGPVAAIMQAVLGLTEAAVRPVETAIANASITRISSGGSRRLITFNAFTHLESPHDLITYR